MRRYLRPLAFTLALIIGAYSASSAQMRIDGLPAAIRAATSVSSPIFGSITGDVTFSTAGTPRLILASGGGAGAGTLYPTGNGTQKLGTATERWSELHALSYYATALVISGTAPSGPVACTSPAVTWSNGTAAFQIDVGSTCAGISTLVVTLPAATNAWSCTAINVTTSATAAVEMTASTTTTATFTNYTRTTGAVLVWVDGADVRISCLGG